MFYASFTSAERVLSNVGYAMALWLWAIVVVLLLPSAGVLSLCVSGSGVVRIPRDALTIFLGL